MTDGDIPYRPPDMAVSRQLQAKRVAELTTMCIVGGDDADASEGTSDLSLAADSAETASRAAAVLPVGTEVNRRYLIQAVLGAGGMGCVYQVRDSLYPNRPTALKTVRSDVDARTAELFRAEFRSMSGLGHPGIARVYDFERIAGGTECFFTMELLTGSSIDAVIGRGDWMRVARLLAQVAHALDYIHRHGVVHLDLKPSNVMVTGNADDERVKVLDFGIAGMKHTTGLFGTLTYVAPELLEGRMPDHRADLYALGVMAFELLTGGTPYADARTRAEILTRKSSRPIQFPADAGGVPPWLRALVERLSAIAPEARPADALEVARLLERGDAADVAPAATMTPASTVTTSKFVGRANELGTAIGHVRRRLQPGGLEPRPCLLVTGPRGIGKTRLLDEVRHHLQLEGIVFLSGAAFADDMADYTPIVPVMLSAASVAHANGAADLLATYGPDVVKLAPGFGGPGVGASTAFANAHAERQRILRAAADFLLALSCRIGLVVCIDDLHWASRGMTDFLSMMLERLPAHPDARLAILGSYRSDGIAGTPFEVFLYQRHGVDASTDLPLPLIDTAETGALAASMLGSTLSGDLVRHLHTVSSGIPFLVEQAVRNAVAAGALAVRGGSLHLAETHGVAFGAMTPRSAVLAGLSRLDAIDTNLIDLMAASGRPIATAILARAAERSPEVVAGRLRSLEERQLVVLLPGEDAKYGLASDSIREAVVAARDPAAKALLHERLATAYDTTLSPEEASERLLEAAAQWMSAPPPDTPARGIARARIGIRAARVAHAAGAYAQALRYLNAAARWLPMSKWHDCRDVALDLEECLAAACIAEDRLDEAEAAGLRIEQYASDALRRAHGRSVWMTCQLRRGHLPIVIESGLALARQLGGRLPRRPHLVHALLAIAQIRRLLTPDVLQRLDRLPAMSDPRALEFDTCFKTLYLATYLSQPTLLPVVVAAAVRLMLSHGLSPSSTHIVGSASMLMAAVGDFDRAFLMSDVNERLIPHSNRESQGVARLNLCGGIRHMRDPFREIRRELPAIRDECLEVGDYVYAGVACVSIASVDVCSGAPLDVTERFAGDPQTVQLVDSSLLTRRMQRAVRQAVHELRRGLDAAGGHRLEDGDAKNDQLGRSTGGYYRLIVDATYRRPTSGHARSIGFPLAIGRMWAGTPYVVENYFSWLMCTINAAREGLPWWRRATLGREVAYISGRLRAMATRNPRNHAHRVTLVEAEWCRYNGRLTDAQRLCERAVTEADTAEDLRLGGLARDLLADVLRELGDVESARQAAVAARERYREWHADGVVAALERRWADAGVPLPP